LEARQISRLPIKSSTLKERRERLNEVPDKYLDQVKSHLVTLFKIKGNRK